MTEDNGVTIYSVFVGNGDDVSSYLERLSSKHGAEEVMSELVDKYLLSGFDKIKARLPMRPYGVLDKRKIRALKEGRLVLSWNLNKRFVGLCLETWGASRNADLIPEALQ